MKRCLIVDDSSVIRRVAKRIIAGPEMLVAEAATAAQAIEICSSELPELIVVDSHLPDMASDDLIRRLMAIDSQVKPQIVLCTSAVDVGQIMRAKRAGAKGYILKPFTRPQLVESFRTFQNAA